MRWGARLLSALILLFWGFFFVAHLVDDAGRSSRPLNTNDYIILTSLGFSLAGLAAAWKWELAGGLLALGSISLCALANWRVLASPGALIPVTACLFLMSWWSGRPCTKNPGRS
jgi:hypothetical protein